MDIACVGAEGATEVAERSHTNILVDENHTQVTYPAIGHMMELYVQRVLISRG